MVIRKTHISSICLMALASAIAITEYVMYTPVIIQDTDDSDITENECSEKNDINDSNKDKEVTESVQEDDEAISSDETQQDENKKLEETKAVDPFYPSGQKEVTINSGDTLASVIGNLGFDKTDIYLASRSLSKIFNLRNLKIGQRLIIKGSRDDSGDLSLTGIEFRPNYSERIVVSKTDTGYNAERIDVTVKKVVRSISGKFSPKNPMYSLKKCGVKHNVSADALKGFANIVNVRASKTPVDFEFLYQDYYDEEGHIVRRPELLYASIFIGGKIKRIYKFKYGNFCDFIDANGTILKTLSKSRSLLSNPMGIMKVTSKFGLRRHPISGRIKGHTGIDISAPVGTPVRATADGVITSAMYYSGYGKYINIKHTGKISTVYAHLSRIVVRGGQHVRRGQIIAYSGNSGNSTGPHLHYEVHVCGNPINPQSFVPQEPQRLSGDKLYKFNQFKRQINMQVVGLTIPGAKSSKHKRF